MIVLGISAHYHDSACALVIDGRPAFALQEERLSRRRFDRALPRRAILAGLRELRLHPADIDVIAYYEDPVAKLSRQLATGALGRRPGEASGFEAAGDLDPRRPVAEIRDFLGWDGTVTVLRHHESHAAAGYFTSGFATAALFTADAVGEWDTTAFGFAEGSDLSTVATVQFPHSLGIFYSAITDYLGFEVNSDEFKVMGLASYGEPTRAGEMSRIVHRTGVLSFATDPRFLDVLGTRHMYREALTGLLGEPPLEPGAPPGPAHADIASSAQHVLEEVACGLVEDLVRETGQRQVVMSGGVALNCSLVARVRRLSGVDDVYVPPAAGDAGSALGAAQLAAARLGAKPPPGRLVSARLGRANDDDTLRRFLRGCDLPFDDFADDEEALCGFVAGVLAKSAVVGWFQGRDEFGPRALGGRSILASPLDAAMREIVNGRVKKREPFRPFAPVVQADRAAEFFHIAGESPFMTETFDARTDRLPAVTHVDGTARLQTVTRTQDSRLYDLLTAFDRAAGVPVLLNTSFNMRGEPIVCTPPDAVACAVRCDLDHLVLGCCAVDLRKVPQHLREAVPSLVPAEGRRGVYTFF